MFTFVLERTTTTLQQGIKSLEIFKKTPYFFFLNGTDMSEKRLQTLIRLLHKEQSDQSLFLHKEQSDLGRQLLLFHILYI